MFARSWFACCHTPAAPACAGDEEEVFELHAEAINITAGIRTVSHGRRNSLDLSRSVRVCVLTEASFVIDGSRMSIDRACPAVFVGCRRGQRPTWMWDSRKLGPPTGFNIREARLRPPSSSVGPMATERRVFRLAGIQRLRLPWPIMVASDGDASPPEIDHERRQNSSREGPGDRICPSQRKGRARLAAEAAPSSPARPWWRSSRWPSPVVAARVRRVGRRRSPTAQSRERSTSRRAVSVRSSSTRRAAPRICSRKTRGPRASARAPAPVPGLRSTQPAPQRSGAGQRLAGGKHDALRR